MKDDIFIIAICYVTALYLIAWWIKTAPSKYMSPRHRVKLPRAIVVRR